MVEEAPIMKFKGTLGLAAAFIVLVLYYFLIDVPTEKRNKEEQARAEKVLLFEADDVESFSIVSENASISLQRTGSETWKMTEPVEAPGDSATASTYLSFLKQLRFIRVVEEVSNDLAVFGLESPSLQISLSLKNGKKQGLRVGDDHPMGNKIYLARTGENRVLTARVARSRLSRSVYELRDKSILDFNSAQVTRLECIRDGKTLVMEKQEDIWNLSEGNVTARGNTDDILNFINSVRAARIREFIEEQPEALTAFGLDRPSLRLTLTTHSKTDTPLSLLIGIKKDAGYYAKTGAGKNVFVVNKSLFDRLHNSRLVEFMDKSLVDLKEDEVAGLTLRTTGNEDIRLVRDKNNRGQWILEHPVQGPANKATVNSLLFDLKDIRITEFVKTFVTDPKPFGLDQPKKELVVTDTSGKDWSLTLGNLTADGTHHFARRAGEKAVFTIALSDTEKIFRSLHDLKDRTLLALKKEEVERIEIRYPKQTFELERKEKGWRLTQPELIDPVKGFIGNDILWTLNSLEFESIVPAPPGDPAPTGDSAGFSPPRLQVSLWDKAGHSLGRVLVGGPVADATKLHYLKVDGKPEVYTVKKRFLDEIPSNINKFKDKPSSD